MEVQLTPHVKWLLVNKGTEARRAAEDAARFYLAARPKWWTDNEWFIDREFDRNGFRFSADKTPNSITLLGL